MVSKNVVNWLSYLHFVLFTNSAAGCVWTPIISQPRLPDPAGILWKDGAALGAFSLGLEPSP